MTRKIDARGILCPKPVIMTKKELEGMEEGEQLLTIVDNEVAKVNMSKLYTNLGYNFEVEEKDDLFYVTGVKGEGEIVSEESGETRTSEKGSDYRTVVFIDKDYIGHGNDELGHVLIKTYIYTLTELENKPNALIFVNGGVKLTTEGSEVLDDLTKLSDMGVEIYSCGTCLDYYEIADKLKVGEVSNMYEIAEQLLNADNTVKM